MGFAKVHSGQTRFLAGQIIDIEIDLSRGLHAFSVVGLGDKAIEEARDRISAAIKNSGFRSPKYKNQKVVISLAPADVRKAGPAFDLAMAIGYLLAAGEIRFTAREKLFLGELSLDGRLRPISGALAIVAEAKRLGFREIFLPKENAREAALIQDVKIFGAQSLAEVIGHVDEEFSREKSGPVHSARLVEEASLSAESLALLEATDSDSTNSGDEIYLEEIKGQESAKRALEIAAAGGHNILFVGPPGAGKTMLAKTLKTILPPLSFEESLEVTAIHSVAGAFLHAENFTGQNRSPIFTIRPFRSPHHTSSYIAIAGGGTHPKPGEMTLAHHGILFLDEFPEFDRRVIEALREPLEEHRVSISRIKGSVVFPAYFMLVAAMNPCPCGYAKSENKNCICTLKDKSRYTKKISGPILDRIDLRIEVGEIDFRKIKVNTNTDTKTETQKARERIAAARGRQLARQSKINAYIAGRDLAKLAPIEKVAEEKLIEFGDKLGLSMRAFHRTWRVARTIADLDDEKFIKERHVLEALQFRGEEDDG
ncbi:MAG: YifB family Mg chelatase-like AAA ATPase [Patescibacteria group bacterium]